MRCPLLRMPIGLGGTLALLAAVSSAEVRIDEGKAAAVKAAYLRYIAEFTTWPQDRFAAEEDPIVIGTLGDDRSGVVAVIRRRIEARGLSAQGRPIVLRPLSLGGPAAEEASRALQRQIEACHIVFLGASLQSSWPRIRSLIGPRAIVTVSEIEGFSRARGMIEFVVSARDRKVAMHIDLTAVRDVGLRLSSRLLGLKSGVKIVRGARDSTARTRDGSSSG